MRYCAATETGYEALSGVSSDIFSPTVVERDEEGKPTKIEPPKATTEDYLKLSISAIIAAYARNQDETPVKSEDILYDATPTDVTNMMKTVISLRQQWYAIPDVVPASETDDAPRDDPKNAERPTTSSKK